MRPSPFGVASFPSKSGSRKPNTETNPKSECSNRARLHLVHLKIRACFEIRYSISNFGCLVDRRRHNAMKIDKAVLLAAGRGTRMREMTADLPKPMLEVRGKPVLQHIVEGLRDAGITNFLIVVGYRAESVQNFFGDGSRYNAAIQYATQTVQDGTGRVVELAKNFV